jgi:phenylalanyl-tRNA synthetase alpha chain|mmetsp:Transcript_28485/g.45796  ORF Transcript_28485/g.45796 Transcript_28485/m.45796 type:complete len:499 (+) Transcript_28485:77-1573(+)|eukprot:CAMPEP_0169101872 /NCGR_PEP_ID=MMETSP1015-20121227/21867_1 /TAXON_ID=342587 /ORGANISM="Karlodinium micrum, Strain CCMP2283" /LENGTH=498 /DNA_ID=CAMNT_0009162939 /DNA_START=63 /DNA_END=1559 /DNA_ORIENTATION=-
MATREALKQLLNEKGSIADSLVLATERGWDHDKLVGVIKSLEADLQVTTKTSKREGWKLTAEGAQYLEKGSPEAQVFKLLQTSGPLDNADIAKALGDDTAKTGVGTAMKNKWISVDKATKKVSIACDKVDDAVVADLANLDSLDDKKRADLKKRKMIGPSNATVYSMEKTSNFTMEEVRKAAEITADMIRDGSWKNCEFKPFNFGNVSGEVCMSGSLHLLNKVKSEIRQNLLLMGFEEMRTNRWVESSFWNFDSLFQPQQHPARDAHDTFFMSDPAAAQDIPRDYLEAVKEMHEKGGQGSIGWRYAWSEEEARKNLLRTHTTAVSARTLHEMAQDYKRTGIFKPKKCFSIDRVFRNETLDMTHLAEFHQVEGLVADRNIGLGHLIGVLREFFRRLGITDLKFKPAYNPYTEPSMEIFGYHPLLKKQVEVGNSGVFRPEMLLPMGLPPDVTVVAWGIGVERTVAQMYGIRSIKSLFSYDQEIGKSKTYPVCYLKAADRA